MAEALPRHQPRNDPLRRYRDLRPWSIHIEATGLLEELRIRSIGLLAILACIVIGYAYFVSRNYLKGPEIIVYEPTNGSTISTSTVIVRGQALRIQDIVFNGRPILMDEQGNFSETLLLFPGYNVALISAQDKTSRQSVDKARKVPARPSLAHFGGTF